LVHQHEWTERTSASPLQPQPNQLPEVKVSFSTK
jgi:hypothetical protein